MRGRRPEITEVTGGLAKIPRAPAWLSQEGKAEWRRVAPTLASRRVLLPAELASLERYADQAGEVRRCRRIIAEQGDLIDGKLHPLHRVIASSLGEARRLGAELGLSPSGRSRQAPVEADDDELLKLVG